MESGNLVKRNGSLAGLVSAEAEQLYERLAVTNSLPIGTEPNEIDMDSPAARELAESDLLYPDPADPYRAQAVSRTIALTLLVSRRQQELVENHERVIRGWSALELLIRTDRESLGNREESDARTIEVIRDRPTSSLCPRIST